MADDDVSEILGALGCGDPRAARDLLPLVYEELRRLADARIAREPAGGSIQATALVHEAYLRIAGRDPDRPWSGRGHFFGAAAEAMRRILVERARARRALKRGGDLGRVEIGRFEPEAPEPSADLIALDEALERLAAIDPRKAELVKLRYFAGLTIPQAADALGISTATAERSWAFARAWLRVEVGGEGRRGGGGGGGAAGNRGGA